ncbi:MAG: hypothetical protein ABI461_17205, partial [Polyangiaceae bacterium]
MQRWLSILLGAGVVALAVMLAFFAAPKHKSAAATSSEEDAGLATTTPAPLDAGVDLTAVMLAEPATTDRTTGVGPGYKMIDGTPVPPMPEHAPRSVTFGVVLVTYAGA